MPSSSAKRETQIVAATRILFVANPTSHTLNKQAMEDIISAHASQYQFDWKAHYTQKEDTKTQIQSHIKRYNPAVVIAVGGDGTINLVGSLLIGTKTQMGVIPAGSANGLAYNLGIPADFTKALQIILKSKAKPFDAIRINDQYFCFHLSDVGINARTVKRFEQENSKGMLAYGKHMLKELISNKIHFSFTLNAKGYKRKYKGEMLVIANAQSYGSGAIINPVGHTGDGRFEIIIIKPYSWWSLLPLASSVFKGRHGRLDYVKILSATHAEIEFRHPQDLQIDGEIIEGITSLKARIIPGAILMRY